MLFQDDRKLLVTYDVYSDARVRIVTITRIFNQSELAQFIQDTVDEFSSQHSWNNLRVEYFDSTSDEQLEMIRFLREYKNEIDDKELGMLIDKDTRLPAVIDGLFRKFIESGLQTIQSTMQIESGKV